MNYCEKQYFGHLVKGNLKGAISYLSQFPEQKNRLERILNRFEKKQFTAYGIAPELEKLLLFYQQYYLDAFYLGMNETRAEKLLCNKLAAHFGTADTKKLSDIEISENATAIGKMAFYSCKSFTKINVPMNVKVIGESAFEKCSCKC